MCIADGVVFHSAPFIGRDASCSVLTFLSPDGNHLFGSVWTKPHPLGKFPSVSLQAWQKFGSIVEFLALQLSNYLFQHSGLALGLNFRKYSGQSSLCTNCFSSFTSTWQNTKHKKPITAPKQKKKSKFSSALLSPRSVASLLLTPPVVPGIPGVCTSRKCLQNIYDKQELWKSSLIVIFIIIQITNCARICNSKMKSLLEIIFMGSKKHRKYNSLEAVLIFFHTFHEVIDSSELPKWIQTKSSASQWGLTLFLPQSKWKLPL